MNDDFLDVRKQFDDFMHTYGRAFWISFNVAGQDQIDKANRRDATVMLDHTLEVVIVLECSLIRDKVVYETCFSISDVKFALRLASSALDNIQKVGTKNNTMKL